MPSIGTTSSAPVTTSSNLVNSLPRTNAGGQFAAAYAGAYVSHPCARKAYVKFSGTGSATFLGESVESLTAVKSIKRYTHRCAGLISFSGSITSKSDPKNAINVTLSPGGIRGEHHFTITGGSGMFALAAGSGTVSITCYEKLKAYSDAWSGTITF